MADARKPCVILGSGRPHGRTRDTIRIAFPNDTVEVVALADKVVQQYGFVSADGRDDFLSIVQKMHLANTLIFATPVYWYAMAAPLKAFFDRFFDLLDNEGGRRLKGKSVWLIATGAEPAMPEGFEIPFRRTAEYFQMRYRGEFYFRTGSGPSEAEKAALAKCGASVLMADLSQELKSPDQASFHSTSLPPERAAG